MQDDLDPPLLGGGPDPFDGVGHDQVDQHRFACRCLLRLDAREVEEVVDDAADPEGLVVDAARQALRHFGVGLRDQRLGQEPERADGCLELVAHVGHEVTADLFEPASFGNVLNERDDPEWAPPVVDLAGPHLQRAPGRTIEIKRALRRTFVPRPLQQLGHRLGGQGVAMAADHERVGAPVAVDHTAVLVAEDHALRQRIEGAPESDGVRAGLGHRLGGAAGDLFEVGQRRLDVRLVLGRVEPQSRAERREALGDRPPSRAAPETGGQGHADDVDDDGAHHEGDAGGGAQRHKFPATDHAPNMTGLGGLR